jgi:hypothetical protein
MQNKGLRFKSGRSHTDIPELSVLLTDITPARYGAQV